MGKNDEVNIISTISILIPMHHDEIINKFLGFFERNSHLIIPDSPLIPRDFDPSALFITAGMHPIKPYFLGIIKPPSKRLCNIQKCFRTSDIDKVGSNERTLTFFFMLGSWSIGDYWKKDAIKYAYDLLVNEFKMDPIKLWPTVFAGDKDVPFDEESYNAWLALGVPKERITKLGVDDNFWSAGPVGPCGPCTEINYDRGKEVGCHKCNKPGCDCDRFLEIWNAGVFMQYNRKPDGSLEPLSIKSVDTGAGLERLALVLQGKDSVFDTTLFFNIIAKMEELSGKKYSPGSKFIQAFRIVADHVRASAFLIAEGIVPSKVERGYVLRRVLRRMIRTARDLGINKEGLSSLFEVVISDYEKAFPYLREKAPLILEVFTGEFDKFLSTLDNGEVRLAKIIAGLKKKKVKIVPGIEVFHLFDTYGFPMELTREICKAGGFGIDEKGFNDEFSKHKETSKGTGERFKSGLADSGERTIKMHTATHILHAALRKVLGTHVEQRGSNITTERLRFDFSHSQKLTSDELRRVEDLVNEKIKEGIPVTFSEMTVNEAKTIGAHGVFESRYGAKVKVYKIGDFSLEICAGPHVKNTKEIGSFKILKEESVGAGVRRIKATVE